MIPNSRINSKLFLALVLVACGIPACAVDSAPTGEVPDLADPTVAPQGGNGGGPEHVPGEVLIQWKAGASNAGKARARGKVNGAFADDVAPGLELAKLPPGLAVSAAAQSLASDPDVEFAEPNFIYHPSVIVDGPEASQLWGMGGGFGSNASSAWAERGIECPNVVVGIVDEGVMSVHPDLADNMLPGLNRDFTSGSEVPYTSLNDTHGTHVAGTIGAVGNNGKGVIGVCGSGIKMVSAKFLGKRGGSTSNAVKAIDYITRLKTEQGLNVVASNNSWGGGGASTALLGAITRAKAAKIMFVAAAGNDGANNDSVASYPSNYSTGTLDDNVIAVAAIKSDGLLASWSNYGKTKVDLAAPGVTILSTYPVTSKGKTTPGYYAISGTSMATPHVTGAVARYASRNPDASIEAIRAAILSNATPTESVATKTVTGGRLNVASF